MLATLALILAQQESKLTGPNLTGDLRMVKDFPSKILHNQRNLRIFLPPDYEKSPKTRYPVLYLHDGQNLFDPALSGFSHNEWRADETTEALIDAKLIPPMILVGIDNTQDRMSEYTPIKGKFGNSEGGGSADAYLKFLIQEVKPYIDSHYRTKKDREHTGIGGSSLGGLVSIYAGLTHSETFSKILVISPSVWWGKRAILKTVEAVPTKLPLQIWVDIGSQEVGTDTKENQKTVQDAADLTHALTKKSWKEGRDLWFFIDYGAAHTESSWARRFGMMLITLYGKKS